MKEKKWRDGNHMIFESLCKTFNKQCDYISTGNVIGTVQLSFFVRPYNEVECNGFTNPPGHLRDFDLKVWRNRRTPHVVLDCVKELTNDGKKIILYCFRHWNNGEEVVHGYVITDDKHNLLKQFVTGRTYKSYSVIEEATKYIVA